MVGNDGWEASHEKEKTFQLTKRRVRFLEAMGEGAILDCELTQADIDDYAKQERANAKKELKYDQRHSRQYRALASPQRPNLSSMIFFTTINS